MARQARTPPEPGPLYPSGAGAGRKDPDRDFRRTPCYLTVSVCIQNGLPHWSLAAEAAGDQLPTEVSHDRKILADLPILLDLRLPCRSCGWACRILTAARDPSPAGTGPSRGLASAPILRARCE